MRFLPALCAGILPEAPIKAEDPENEKLHGGYGHDVIGIYAEITPEGFCHCKFEAQQERHDICEIDTYNIDKQ
jgi:hypothetical protein